MSFKINKKSTVDDFRSYIKKFDKPSDDYQPKHAKKLVTPTKYFVLDKIRSLYQWVLQNSLLDLRRTYIHNDDDFRQFKGDLENYIRNKIRSQSDGAIYIQVKDLKFYGDQDQYKQWLVSNKTKLLSVIRKIIDELNDYLEGNPIEDDNKPVLNGSLYEEVDVEEPAIEELSTTNETAVCTSDHGQDEDIFIEVSLSLKDLMEEINNEQSD